MEKCSPFGSARWVSIPLCLVASKTLNQLRKKSSRSAPGATCSGTFADLGQKGLKEPYDWDEYAQMYFPKAEELSKIAEEAEKAGEKEKASEYYLFVADLAHRSNH